MPSRRSLLRYGGGLLAAGSLAGVGERVVRSGNAGRRAGRSADDGESTADERPASVLVAGSLQQLASEVGETTVEAHGSVACRRLLEDGLRDPDAVALADPRLFSGLADRVTYFATNALVVAVGADTAGEYDDWRELLADPDCSLGRTDPEQDPLGYRTAMALELAAGIDAESVLSRATVFPETGLLRTLEAGGIDAAFAYRNMAVEHDLSHFSLPNRIDFSDPELADEYAEASVELAGQTVTGTPIRYAAHSRTDRGARWVRRLANATWTLEESGFSVPKGYPTDREVHVSKSGKSSGAS